MRKSRSQHKQSNLQKLCFRNTFFNSIVNTPLPTTQKIDQIQLLGYYFLIK